MATVGRPRIIQSPDEFEERAEAYFAAQTAAEQPITVTGLALALGLSSRQALGVYEERPEFCDAVRRAKLRVESAYENRLHGNSPTGAIFALKNMSWSDKQEIAHSGTMRVSLNSEDATL